MRFLFSCSMLIATFCCGPVLALDQSEQCDGKLLSELQRVPKVWKMADGIATYAKLNINIDGYGRAYHRKNYETDAVIHLCNAGQVFLPDGSSYHGSESNATCTGKFMSDVARIEAAGWNDPEVGAIRWYGILGTGNSTIKGHTIEGVVPVSQSDGSGYYVSPTALYDGTVPEAAQQDRYINPLTIPAAVIPARLQKAGIQLGSFGVAISRKTNIAVPFIVGDAGPRVGEGTPALARQLAGLPLLDSMTRKNRYAGQIDTQSVLWVFFGDDAVKYDHASPQAVVEAAKEAFERWGGSRRLAACQKTIPL